MNIGIVLYNSGKYFEAVKPCELQAVQALKMRVLGLCLDGRFFDSPTKTRGSLAEGIVAFRAFPAGGPEWSLRRRFANNVRPTEGIAGCFLTVACSYHLPFSPIRSLKERRMSGSIRFIVIAFFLVLGTDHTYSTESG